MVMSPLHWFTNSLYFVFLFRVVEMSSMGSVSFYCLFTVINWAAAYCYARFYYSFHIFVTWFYWKKHLLVNNLHDMISLSTLKWQMTGLDYCKALHPLLTCNASLPITISSHSLGCVASVCKTKCGKSLSRILNSGDYRTEYCNRLWMGCFPGLYWFPISELLWFPERCFLY